MDFPIYSPFWDLSHTRSDIRVCVWKGSRQGRNQKILLPLHRIFNTGVLPGHQISRAPCRAWMWHFLFLMPGSDNRRAAIWAWMCQFLGTLVFSARACLRELNTHTHAWIKEFQTIKELFCVKMPVVLSKNICVYPPILTYEALSCLRWLGEGDTHFRWQEVFWPW